MFFIGIDFTLYGDCRVDESEIGEFSFGKGSFNLLCLLESECVFILYFQCVHFDFECFEEVIEGFIFECFHTMFIEHNTRGMLDLFDIVFNQCWYEFIIFPVVKLYHRMEFLFFWYFQLNLQFLYVLLQLGDLFLIRFYLPL